MTHAGSINRKVWAVALALALGAACAHATVVPGLVPPGLYQFDRVGGEAAARPSPICLPMQKFEDVFGSNCVIERDNRQAGLTHFQGTCLNTRYTTTVRRIDQRTWETTDEVVVRQATPAQMSAHLASRRADLEKKASKGSAEAKQELAALDAMAAMIKDAPPAAPVKPFVSKATFRLTRLGDCP